MNQSSVVATFRQGEALVVPAHAIQPLGIDDGTPLVFEPREGGLLVRPMTTQGEIEWERASGAPREIFYSDEEFEAYLDALPAADDPA